MRKDKPPCPVLKIWSGQIHGHFIFSKNDSIPLNGMGYKFLHFMFAFAAALSPGSRAEQWDSDHSAKAALWHPRMIFDLQHGRAGAAAGELLNFTTCILCSLA